VRACACVCVRVRALRARMRVRCVPGSRAEGRPGGLRTRSAVSQCAHGRMQNSQQARVCAEQGRAAAFVVFYAARCSHPLNIARAQRALRQRVSADANAQARDKARAVLPMLSRCVPSPAFRYITVSKPCAHPRAARQISSLLCAGQQACCAALRCAALRCAPRWGCIGAPGNSPGAYVAGPSSSSSRNYGHKRRVSLVGALRKCAERSRGATGRQLREAQLGELLCALLLGRAAPGAQLRAREHGPRSACRAAPGPPPHP
jgi:hypothetical protein